MNNIKINSYSLKKNPSGISTSTIQSTSSKQQGPESNRENFPSEKEKNSLLSHLHSNLMNEVNKIIKTPSLNISSKLDSKGNRSININFFDKQVKNKIESKHSKDSKVIEQELTRELKNTQLGGIPEDCEGEKNINIKLNINSEVINNNIKIRNKSENTTHTTKNNSSENFNNLIELKDNLNYYKELVAEKEKIIEQLITEINILKGRTININKDRSNSLTISAPMYLNKQNNLMSTSSNKPMAPEFKLDLKTKLKDKTKNNIDICSERRSHNNSIITKALGVNPNKNPNEIPVNPQISNFLIDNLKGKTLNITNYFRKSNSNSNNKNLSIGTLNPDKVNYSHFNPHYKTNLDIITLSPKTRELKSINEVLKSTMLKLEDLNKKESNNNGQNKLLFPATSESNSNNENISSKLNLLKSRTSKLLKSYSDYIHKNNKI